MRRLVVEGLDGLRALVGAEIPPSDWFAVDQDRVDLFAACTDDVQWIHVDPERARTSAFGGTIAHGYLVLALLPALWHRHVDVRDIDMAINAGVDRVRFVTPLRVGTRIRARFEMLEANETPRGLRTRKRVTVEAEGVIDPICIAEVITLYCDAAT